MSFSASPKRPASSVIATAILAGVFGLGASPSPSAPPATRPATCAPTVALRMDVTGGFAPFPLDLTTVPPFTLYADGRVLFRSLADRGDDSLRPLLEADLRPAVADALTTRALERFGLRDAREEYVVKGVADATTTIFTVHADGVDKTVSIYGLGFGDGPRRRSLRGFERLAARLSDPRTWLPADVSVSEYEPALYRGIFTEDDPEGTEVMPWPWTDLSPADLQPVGDAVAYSQVDLRPEQVAVVADQAGGSASGIAISSPDGLAAWRLSVRPLLPDEVPLPAAAPASPAPSPSAATSPTSDAASDAYAYADSA
jgi:hypothetical protein